jgi:hypothetical protein
VEYPLNQEKTEAVWCALADIFSVPYEDFSYIAKKINDVEIEIIKEIFFNDVAPVFAFNLVITTPELLGFETKYVINEIKKEKKKIQKSKIKNTIHHLNVLYLKWNLKELWVKFEYVLNMEKKN